MDTAAMRTGAAFLAVMVSLTLPATALAQAQRLDEDPATPRMMALGGRAEAISSSTSAMFANPSALVASRVYHADGLVLYDPTVGRFTVGSAVVDSTRNAVAAGVSYLFTTVPGESRTSHDVRLNVTFPIANVLGIGGTVRYLALSSRSSAAGSTELNAREWSGFTFDAGLFLRPVSWLQLSASGRNLNNPTVAPIGVGCGVAVMPLSTLTVVADALVDFRTNGSPRGRYSGGVELFLGNHYPLRVGYLYDDVRQGAQAVTAGIGYLDENFGVEFALRQGIVPEPQTTLLLSLRYFYRPPMQ